MRSTHLRAIVALAVIAAPSAALAQAGQAKPITNDQSITVLQGMAFGTLGKPATPVDADHPMPMEQKVSAATSAKLSYAGSTTATFGPWTPQLGRTIYAAFAITGGTASLSVTATTTGSCADGYQLSSANGTFVRGAFSSLSAGRYRESLGGESQSGAQLCVTITPAAGATVNGTLGQ